MSMGKNEQGYQSIINDYIQGKKQFIDSIRTAINQQTSDLQERKHRLETFDALLLRATYASREELEDGFNKGLSSLTDPTLSYITEHLREMNGFCKQSFSDEHEVYQNIYNTITFLTPEIKGNIREQFSQSLTHMIFDKTGTSVSNKQGLDCC